MIFSIDNIDSNSTRFKVIEDLLHRNQIGLADALELLHRPTNYTPIVTNQPVDVRSTGTYTYKDGPSTATLS